ncbi:Cold shock protein, CspA family [Succinivibrio dextrinosolvens]|uniref:cold-shock protein n=1 Tax=Succinivibrio dextrinosolvens TaxID=83771 RepID=UPI0008E84BF9|nr:cold shock domain-containing protein [Succinivibrio dextrinosolvens]SFS31716.1 Cold shock protein, CspA family [Succinivibrio dextrinosolvens]
MEFGIVKSFVADKGYGFIQTEQETVFFHLNDVLNEDKDKIKIGQAVKFDVIPTPKGNKATAVSIADKDELRFVIPTTPIFSFGNDKLPDGNIVLEDSNFEIFVEVRNPHDMESYFNHYLTEFGANAVINIRDEKYTGEERARGSSFSFNYRRGIHYFTIHKFIGKVAIVGKISSNGQKYSDINLKTIVAKKRINRIQFSKNQRIRIAKKLAISSPIFFLLSFGYYLIDSDFSIYSSLLSSLFLTFLFAVIATCFLRKDNPYEDLLEIVRNARR